MNETPLFKKLHAIVKPILDAAEHKCPGVCSDFQLSPGYTVEISLTVEEIRDIAVTFDPLLFAKLQIREQLFIDGKDE